MSVRLWLLALTGDRLDDLIHIGAVRIIRALHRRRWSGGGAVLVVEREKQPEVSVAAARTIPRDMNFIMQVP